MAAAAATAALAIMMAAGAGAAVPTQSPAPPPKPHLVMFVVDDLGWYNVGWHNPDMITPHSDQLVREGVELDRSYVFFYCAPTRSSIMSGRLPYHVNQIILQTWNRDWDMPREMTALPAKLKQAGYATHMVGKWHVGSSNPGQTPHGRGFDTAFHFFDGAEDHWTQGSCVDRSCNIYSSAETANDALEAAGWVGNSVDLWCTDQPCWGRNGSVYKMGRNGQVVGDLAHYGDHMFADEAVRIIGAHDAAVPLFFYVAFQCNHEPLEAPDEYIEMYPAEWRSDRRWYAGMTTFWDAALGNITGKLRVKGMWDDTLIVLTTDNGGPTYWAPPGEDATYPHGGGANNWPLRGSKVSNWEGGVRGASFVAGGFLPPRVRGTKLEEYVHVTDWYATFCGLAGVDPADPSTEGARSDGTRYALPPVDSIDVWPLVSGAVAASPRTEIPICIHHAVMNTSALIVGDYKLLLGRQVLAYWQGPAFPNGTAPYGNGNGRGDLGPAVDCGDDLTMQGGCLFDIRRDPAETTDLAATKPDVLARLKARYATLLRTALRQEAAVQASFACRANETIPIPDCPPPPEYIAMLHRNKGFVGPFLP